MVRGDKMVNILRASSALSAFALAGVIGIGVSNFYGNIGRNQFIEYAKTPEGKQELTTTLTRLREFPNDNTDRIVNLERVLSAANNVSIGRTQCPFLAPLCIDDVADIFDEYRDGYRGI